MLHKSQQQQLKKAVEANLQRWGTFCNYPLDQGEHWGCEASPLSVCSAFAAGLLRTVCCGGKQCTTELRGNIQHLKKRMFDDVLSPCSVLLVMRRKKKIILFKLVILFIPV